MLIIDMSNVFFSSVHEFTSRTSEELDENTLRAMIIRRLFAFKRNLKIGNDRPIILAFDARDGYWRKDFFPHYKAKRKVIREESKVDWDSIFLHWNKICEEFKLNLPMISISAPHAEADDIFAALCFKYARKYPEIMIASSDEDTVQLQLLYPNVKQYSLKRKKLINVDSVNYNLFEHIVKGDAGDGIPNILSPENALIDGIRQTSVRKTKMDEWRNLGGMRYPEKFCDTPEMLERFKINKMMVDFNEIPLELIEQIDEVYRNTKKPVGRMFSYLAKHQLTAVMDDIN